MDSAISALGYYPWQSLELTLNSLCLFITVAPGSRLMHHSKQLEQWQCRIVGYIWLWSGRVKRVCLWVKCTTCCRPSDVGHPHLLPLQACALGWILSICSAQSTSDLSSRTTRGSQILFSIATIRPDLPLLHKKYHMMGWLPWNLPNTFSSQEPYAFLLTLEPLVVRGFRVCFLFSQRLTVSLCHGDIALF